MLKICTLLVALPIVAASCTSPTPIVSSQDYLAWQDDGEMAMDEEMMAKVMAFGTPGEAHRNMATRVGTWNISSSITMSPGGASMQMDTVSEVKMILDGHFLVEESSGMMMGMPYSGQLTMGFNNATEEWWTIWLDSMSTGFATCKGKADKDGVIHMTGTMVDGVSPEGRPYRSVTTVAPDEKTFVVTLYDTLPDGTEWEVMVMNYTRAEEKR